MKPDFNQLAIELNDAILDKFDNDALLIIAMKLKDAYREGREDEKRIYRLARATLNKGKEYAQSILEKVIWAEPDQGHKS